jgi:uncharacterized protein
MRSLIHNGIILLALAALAACASAKKSTTTGAGGNTRTQTPQMLDANTNRLSTPANDPNYGQQQNPIKVGGVMTNGAFLQRCFLNALLGPNGERTAYRRLGSCCQFKTPNGFDGMGLLDQYEITWTGQSKPVILYLNFYDEGDLLIPDGFTAKR